MRERQYTREASRLTMRPYPLMSWGGRAPSWEWLDRDLLGPANVPSHAFRGFREERDAHGQRRLLPNGWSGSRNRVKRLGSLVGNGKDEVRRQVDAWRAADPGLQLPGELPVDGFIGPETPLVDAIELVDLHLRLDGDPRVARETPATAAIGDARRNGG